MENIRITTVFALNRQALVLGMPCGEIHGRTLFPPYILFLNH